jgi:hypothetical protein
MKTRHLTAALAFAGLVAGAITIDGANIAVAESTYQPWSGSSQAQSAEQTPTQRLQKLLADLKALVKKAEDADAADPAFIADLKKLAGQYEPLGGPGTVFLYDNFADGEYTSNPAWQVGAGSWRVDIKGSNTGLYSTLQQPSGKKVTATDVLQSVLGTQQQQTASPPAYASIQTPVKISNSFKLTLKMASADKGGPLNVGPFQGVSASSAYRLVYQPGSETGIVLQRISGNEVTQIASYNDPVNLEDGKVHDLQWQREASGKMRVFLDGQQLIIATDKELSGPFDGWLNINQGGSYWIREIKVEGI